VHAPSWPGLESDVEAIRADPSPLEKVTISTIVDHYDTFIRGLDQAPIIIGHSFGGLFMQLLVDRGLGAAGVGVSAAQPRGVAKLPLSTIKSGSRILRNPLNRGRAVKYTLADFHYTMTNTLSVEESIPYYERYSIPGAGRILFEGAAAQLNPRSAAKVDFARTDRAPMLFIANGRDHVVPTSVTKAIHDKYQKKSSARIDYVEYPDRPHLPGVPGWEEVADHALEWALTNARNTET
jgi:pimeloyl-ACP methyl ester carboxylesterase